VVVASAVRGKLIEYHRGSVHHETKLSDVVRAFVENIAIDECSPRELSGACPVSRPMQAIGFKAIEHRKICHTSVWAYNPALPFMMSSNLRQRGKTEVIVGRLLVNWPLRHIGGRTKSDLKVKVNGRCISAVGDYRIHNPAFDCPILHPHRIDIQRIDNYKSALNGSGSGLGNGICALGSLPQGQGVGRLLFHSFHQIFEPVRLSLGSIGKIVGVLSARPHFEPLQTDEDSCGENHEETSNSPSKGRTLEGAHALFYLVQIGLGCWLVWPGVFWLGFADRRALCGLACILGAIVLVCHGALSALMEFDKLYYKKCLTDSTLCNTVSDMANVLPLDKQIAVIAALAEGSSLRSIERITGIHHDTAGRLAVRVGKGCEMLMDSKMQDLGCNYLQLDEVWGYIGKKEKHLRPGDPAEYGDVWTFCAIDSETKLVPSFKCGKRTHELANEFVQDIAGRMHNRVQISTDAMNSYPDAIEQAFGADVDYGQIVKVYVHDSAQHPEHKYSAPSFASAYRRAIAGNPDMELVSTSHVERLNATTRLHVKRLSRLTLAFSKKLENFKAAVALHFAYYNFVRRHNTLRCTPAMAAGIERDFWSVGQLVEATT
jgi:IS1 family transposase